MERAISIIFIVSLHICCDIIILVLCFCMRIKSFKSFESIPYKVSILRLQTGGGGVLEGTKRMNERAVAKHPFVYSSFKGKIRLLVKYLLN